jgi:hypothetical protein
MTLRRKRKEAVRVNFFNEYSIGLLVYKFTKKYAVPLVATCGLFTMDTSYLLLARSKQEILFLLAQAVVS